MDIYLHLDTRVFIYIDVQTFAYIFGRQSRSRNSEDPFNFVFIARMEYLYDRTCTRVYLVGGSSIGEEEKCLYVGQLWGSMHTACQTYRERTCAVETVYNQRERKYIIAMLYSKFYTMRDEYNTIFRYVCTQRKNLIGSNRCH